ncbi:hypothetical protein [Leptospira sarikeiensis]|uniref:DUF1554 domain-containing protein n=1 Tax=Leptospira sarikeiensis TaxID=2484943 RepID=A0A4R9K5C0_9LEPT|nr:hypothetical protein [Leptospira sarikeiensis]TGL61405.1 hypothetical protein EHQ64_10480 [Leptospira sarikeiensis]
MINRIFLILILSLFVQTCITDKTCSDQDRTCNPQANLLSLLLLGPDGIYIYASNASYQGNLSVLGTGALDSSLNFLCGQELAFSNMTSNRCSKVAPLVSTTLVPVNSIDIFYADFPTTEYPVRGPNGTMVASDYASLFTVDLEVSLEKAGTGNISFWSFSDGAGNTATDSCSNGEDNTSLLGASGVSNVTTSGSWLGTSTVTCSQTHKVLCMCYIPVSGGG